MHRILFASLIAFAGCASGPYSYIESDSFGTRAEMNTHPVQISAVDGRLSGLDRIRVEPGEHSVTAYSLQPRSTRRVISEYTTTIMVEACKTYSLGAEHRDSLAEEWQLVVVDVRPIPGCGSG